MKRIIFTSILLGFLAAGTAIKAQAQEEERLGLPGDNLNLYGVMKLFRESETLEGFEKALNDEKSKINNLDLDGNNLIDYIRVIDNVDNDVHTIVLQVPVSERENQDVAVFTVQRDQDGKVFIQLIGDEDLYGKDYIIEPIYDDDLTARTPNPGYIGNDKPSARRVAVVRTTAVEIATWPVVRFIYLPGYSGWRSSWNWGYYPSYWQPWRPYYWDYYYGFHYNWYDDYYSHYRRWDHYRYSRWNDFYYVGHRQHSVYVYSGIQKGTYKSTYSRPEQRREGEADFVKMYPSQTRRSSESSTVNSNSRRTQGGDSKSSSEQTVGTSRRSTQGGTVRSESEKSSPQSTTTRRSSSTTSTTKSVAKPANERRTEAARPSTKSSRPAESTTTRRSSTTTKSTPVRKTEKTESTKSTKSERRK